MNSPLKFILSGVAALLIVSLVAGYMMGSAPKNTTPFNYEKFGDTPVMMGGRVKPLDSVARNHLMMIRGKSTPMDKNGERVLPAQWMADVLLNPPQAAQYKVFRIDNLDVKTLLGVDESEKYYSLVEIFDPEKRELLLAQFERARNMPGEQRGAFETNVMALAEKIRNYQMIDRLGTQLTNPELRLKAIHPIPPLEENGAWRNWFTASRDAQTDEATNTTMLGWQDIQEAYLAGDAGGFNNAVSDYHGILTGHSPGIIREAAYESGFNRLDPFMWSTALYVGALVLVFVSWLGGRSVLAIAAAAVILIALIMQTYGITARIMISGRPPVTNLYSSAVFIGWGTVLLCLILELIYRNTFGLVTACVVGFMCLLISRGLATDGDTITVMQAVLDTNFWLATHVVTITLGYSAVFLAGILGIVFIVAGIFSEHFDKKTIKSIGQMIYGTTAFAVLLSFVGTVLGGIWADQSWGRFWGWDPKENGAVLIVLWTALMLHARWGGMVLQRGLAVLAVFGGIVTSWSWFGTNMLGAGLHSYGFTDSRHLWLWAYVFSQLLVMNVGMHPSMLWATRSLPKQSTLTPEMAGSGLLILRMIVHTLISFALVCGTVWCLLEATTNMGRLGLLITGTIGALLVGFASLASSNAWIRLLNARSGGQADPPAMGRRAPAAGS